MSESPVTTRLTGKQNRFLRGLGHGLKPFVMIEPQRAHEQNNSRVARQAQFRSPFIPFFRRDLCLLDRVVEESGRLDTGVVVPAHQFGHTDRMGDEVTKPVAVELAAGFTCVKE